MEQHYKLHRVRELAENDEDFVVALVGAFLEEVPEDAERLRNSVPVRDYKEIYQAAHKMKPTIDLFELGVYDELIQIQDFGKFEQTDKDVSNQLQILLTAVDNAVAEMKEDFGL